MKSYIVEEGDNIVSIARKFGIRVTDLVDSNNLGNNYYLEPGTELLIPLTIPSGFNYYIVQKNDNLTQIAKKNNIDLKLLANINGIDTSDKIYPGDKILVPRENIKVYITEENDRLNDLANKFNILKEEIVFYNPNLYLLPGQIITYKEEG